MSMRAGAGGGAKNSEEFCRASFLPPPAGSDRRGTPVGQTISQILQALETAAPSTDARATDELMQLVYEELRELARRMMADERPGLTLQPTALVHEAYLRL